jgi:hypothetical protein
MMHIEKAACRFREGEKRKAKQSTARKRTVNAIWSIYWSTCSATIALSDREIHFHWLQYKIKLATRGADVAKWQTQRT